MSAAGTFEPLKVSQDGVAPHRSAAPYRSPDSMHSSDLKANAEESTLPDSMSQRKDRQSFAMSQYRQSGIIEMGSAIPLVISGEEPREIEIERVQESIMNMGSMLSDITGHRNALRRVSQSSPRPLPPSLDPPANNGEGSEGEHLRALGAPWSPGSRSTMPRGPPPKVRAPPVPPMPFQAPPPLRRPTRALSTDEIDTTYATDEYSDSSSSPVQARGLEDMSAVYYSAAPSPSKIRDDSIPPPLPTASSSVAPPPPLLHAPASEHLSKLRQIISDDDDIFEVSRFSWNEPYMPTDPSEVVGPLTAKSSHPDPTQTTDHGQGEHTSDPVAPRELGHPNRASNKVAGPSGTSSLYGSSGAGDTSSSKLRNRNRTASHELPKIPTEDRMDSWDQAGTPAHGRHGHHRHAASMPAEYGRVLSTEAKTKHKHRHRRSQIPEEPPHSHIVGAKGEEGDQSQHGGNQQSDHPKRSASRRRRNFTKRSIANMLASDGHNYDINDIGLPAPERRLLEQFIDSLSKLSIEVQMDEGKRTEGRRRLNNALRALEGWI